MLNNLVVSIEAVLPLFILMSIGLIIKKAKVLTPEEIKHFNHMVFLVFFPEMMFASLYGKNIADAINVKLIIFGVVMVFLIYFIGMAVVMPIEKTQESRGAMIQAIYRSNFVIMGLPIASNICGSSNLAVTAMMVAIIVPLYNVLAVITLEVFRGGKPKLSHILVQLAKNPLLIGAACGIIAIVTGLQLPKVIENVVFDMSDVATPLAVIILGASISRQSIERCRRDLIICVVGRLGVAPAIGLTLAALLGFRGVAFVTLIAIFASPTAVSSFTMAESMDSDGELAGNCVVFSTALSCFTMFIWIFIFKTLGMF